MKRILIVDDSLEFLRMMEMVLTGAGYEAETTPTATGLPEDVRQTRPSLIISDLRVPGLDLEAFLRDLRAAPETSEIPVIICTGAWQDARRHLRSAHASRTDVLAKPFDLDDLLERVRGLIGE